MTRQRSEGTPKNRGGTGLRRTPGQACPGPRAAPPALPAVGAPQVGVHHPHPSLPRPGAGPALAAEGARRAHLGVGRGQAAHVAVAERAVGPAAAAVGAGLSAQRRRVPLHPASRAPLRCARSAAPARPRRTGSATRRFPQSPAETSRLGMGSATTQQRACETGGRGYGKGAGPGGQNPMRAPHADQMGGVRGEGSGLSNRKADSSEGGGARR